MSFDGSQIVAELQRRIEDVTGRDYEGPRWHLGASEIGDECLRRSWMKYRWIKREQHSGAMRRLFRRGHREEIELRAILEAIGCTVGKTDATGAGLRGSGVLGHYGGTGDDRGYIPPELFNQPCLFEYKTHNDASFNQLVKHGLRKSKMKHFIQMNVYGAFLDIWYCLYVAVNKNTDEIYLEFLELDRDVAANSYRKAETLIRTSTPPRRINDKATFYLCRICHLRGVCHHGESAEKNCRSCRNAIPVEDGKWLCQRFNVEITREFAPIGCENWASII